MPREPLDRIGLLAQWISPARTHGVGISLPKCVIIIIIVNTDKRVNYTEILNSRGSSLYWSNVFSNRYVEPP